MTLSTMLRRQCVMRSNPKYVRSWWLGTALVLVANGAFAADCDMRLSNTEVNYGALNRGEMNIRGNAPIDLGSRQLTLTAVCRQAEPIGLRFEGDAVDPGGYRFAGKGRFTVKLSNATLDGNAVQLARTGSGSDSSTGAVNAVELRPNERVIAIAQGLRAAGKVFSAQVEIQTFVDEASTRARDITGLEGRGALTLDTK